MLPKVKNRRSKCFHKYQQDSDCYKMKDHFFQPQPEVRHELHPTPNVGRQHPKPGQPDALGAGLAPSPASATAAAASRTSAVAAFVSAAAQTVRVGGDLVVVSAPLGHVSVSAHAAHRRS